MSGDLLDLFFKYFIFQLRSAGRIGDILREAGRVSVRPVGGDRQSMSDAPPLRQRLSTPTQHHCSRVLLTVHQPSGTSKLSSLFSIE